jgi:hypothetical protein
MQTRKGWQELVTAFLEEFAADEPVSLVLRTGGKQRIDQLVRTLTQRPVNRVISARCRFS